MAIRAPQHGDAGPWAIVLHGGPGAPGDAAPLARGLSDAFRVLEPHQRGSGDRPLTVARHVADLHDLIRARGLARPPLVGHSWGAMLALAYGAEHPLAAGPLALVGCGTFDTEARARMQQSIDRHLSPEQRRRLDRLEQDCPDPGERLERRYEIIAPLYDYDPVEGDATDAALFDGRANTETWQDMLRLQAEGVYPEAFSAIESPILMLHGTHDPHPGRMICASLRRHLPQLEYREFRRCGHRPWLERRVRKEFFDCLRCWLTRHLPGA